MRFFRSIPLALARTVLTAVLVVLAAAHGGSHRWILERHWVNLSTFPSPMGWVIIDQGAVIWGGKDGGYAVGGFSRDIIVQWHAWPRGTIIAMPAPTGQFRLLQPTLVVSIATALVWFLPMARAVRRRRLGLCECGYDLRGLAAGTTCPECGVRAKR